jgi:hypothetical protein
MNLRALICCLVPVLGLSASAFGLERPDGPVPGFDPRITFCSLAPAKDCALPQADLTLAGRAWLDGSTVLRLGTLAPWAGTADLELHLSDGVSRVVVSPADQVTTPGASPLQARLMDARGEVPVAAVLHSMPGAAVVEVRLRGTLLASGPWVLETVRQGQVLDRIEVRDGERTDHSVAFLHHGNQGLTWTDVLWGHENNSHEQHWADYLNTGSTHNGFDEILGLHDLLDLPVNLQVAGTLQTAAEWYYPGGGPVEGWNDWVARGVTEGWAALVASAYAQHIMPFVQDSMNDWAVHTHVAMTEWRYGYTPHVAWVPERVWVSPQDNDGNGTDTSPHVIDWIGDNWLEHGVYAVVLDQEEHCDYQNTWWNDRHIYTIDVPGQGTLNVIPISGSFTGNCHHDAGAAWNQIITSSPDELLLYATDWEVAAEVAGFQNQFPSALENMIWIAQQVAGSMGSASSVTLDQAVGGYTGGPINLQNGTYGLLGGRGGYGSDWLSPGTHNSWYSHWAGSPAQSDQHQPQWNYGQVWNDAWTNLMSCPANDLSETAWYVLMTNLYETGWHDGSQISGWIHRYASHIKNANVYAEASRWVDGQYANPCAAYFSDIDRDGADEIVLHNERVFAVFESIGGRAPWIFTKGPGYDASVVGSCSAYWVDTEGDYNDLTSLNHIAAFSDVSPDTQHQPYTMQVDSSSAGLSRVTLSRDGLSKSFTLEAGNPWITVDYDATQETYIRHGFTPDYIDLLWSARTERLWDPSASWPSTGYAGQRNPNTGATAALVLGNGGTLHSSEFQGTLVRGDEIRGSGRFRYLFYAGVTGEPDSTNGEVAELESLAALNLDATPPRLDPAASFLAPNKALLAFDEAVSPATATVIASYGLAGMPGVTIVSAAVQADPRVVALTLAGLTSGSAGTITAAGVTDLNGNPADPAHRTAQFTMPSGLTPHTVLVDGVNDFIHWSEWMEQSTDSLFITWDSLYLYIGYRGLNLAAGDFFVYIDTSGPGSAGAPRSAWDRVGFTTARRPEFELSIEGGGNSMQLNAWNTSWSYQQYGQHGGTSYEGWSGNIMTEVRVPWSELGNPGQLALALSTSQENNQQTTRSWPAANPVGNNITVTDWFVFDATTVGAPMPAMGVTPNGSVVAVVPDPPVVTVSREAGQLRLDWQAVPGAQSYIVYRSTQPWGLGTFVPTQQTTDLHALEPIGGSAAFFVVRSVGP